MKRIVISLLFFGIYNTPIFSMEKEETEEPIHIQGNSKVIEAATLFKQLSEKEQWQFLQIVKGQEQEQHEEPRAESSVMQSIKKKLRKPWEKLWKSKQHYEDQRQRVADAYEEDVNDALTNPNDISNT